MLGFDAVTADILELQCQENIDWWMFAPKNTSHVANLRFPCNLFFFPTDWYMNIYGKDWYSTPTGQFTGVTQIRKPFGHLKVSDQLYMSKSWGSDGLIYKLTDERISI